MTEQNSKASMYAEYSRKSTDDKEKQVLSLESQRDVLDKLKQNHKLSIVETIEEKMSAKKPGRPAFGQLIALVKKKKIDGIVTWAPHRLSRNPVDTGEIIDLFDRGLLKEIVTESHVYRNNPMDMFMLGFNCLQAKFENDNKAIDVMKGMVTTAKNGIYPGCPPLGYLPDKYGIKGARKRKKDPINFLIVRKMWDLMLAGTHTPYQILTKAITEWGLRTRTGNKPSNSTIYKIFHNPFYYGEFEYPLKSGIWYKGHHQPMITKAEFEQVQKMMRRPDNPRPIRRYFAYGGRALHCSECGCAITGMAKTKTQNNGNVHHYVYYGCTKKRGICSQMPVTEKAITENTETILKNLQMPRSVHDFMMQWVKDQQEKLCGDIIAQNASNRQACEAIEKKTNGLIEMRAMGLINDEEFQRLHTEAATEQNRLQLLIDNTNRNIDTWYETADKLFRFVEVAAIWFKEASPERRRGILLSLGWNLGIKDRKLDLTKEKWIEPVTEIAKHVNEIITPLEPKLSIQDKVKLQKLVCSPYLCSLLQDVGNFFTVNREKKRFSVLN